MRRLFEEVKRAQSILPAVRNIGTVNGTAVDTSGADGVGALVMVGDMPASSTLDVKLQESDDNSNWADITGAAIVQLGQTDDNKSPTIDVRFGDRANRKKYVRAVGVVAGANSAVYGVEILLYGNEKTPVTNSPATVFVA